MAKIDKKQLIGKIITKVIAGVFIVAMVFSSCMTLIWYLVQAA